jgi:hypothetical protein
MLAAEVRVRLPVFERSIVIPMIETGGSEEPTLIWRRRTRINNGGEYTCSSFLYYVCTLAVIVN